MKQYTVRSGQNIYDVAMTLYGSVEGVFDLLASNDWLNMETALSYGTVLNYHEDFIINKDLVIWFKDNNITVKNGEHIYKPIDIEEVAKDHIESSHVDLYDSVQLMSPDEQNMFWESLCRPRMVVHQQGQSSAIKIKLKPEKHLIIDWGDYSAPQIIEGAYEQEIEHCYKSTGEHIMTLFGEFECDNLDLTELYGVYYPLGEIYADSFISLLDNDDLNHLILKP